LGLEAHLLALCQRPEGSVEEDRESVDAGPRRVLDVRATGGRQDSSFDEVVEGRLQMVKRPRLAGFVTGRMIVGG
jgi:hypothetical protein